MAVDTFAGNQYSQGSSNIGDRSLDGLLTIRAEMEEQPQQPSLMVLIVEVVGFLTKLLDRYNDGAMLVMIQYCHPLATGIIQRCNGFQIGNSGSSGSLLRARGAGHVYLAWAFLGGKVVPEGSYL